MNVADVLARREARRRQRERVQTAADLRATATYIREHGWWQGGWGEHRVGGAVCILGGLGHVVGWYFYAEQPGGFELPVDTVTRFDRGFDAIAAVIGGGNPQIGRWNDSAKRHEQDIYDALEKAALRLEEQA